MTTFEHAMVGINGALAAGMHRRYEWRIVALAGLAAISPDWDGLTILGGMQLFDQAHRAWGHSVFTCAALAFVLATIDYRYDLVGYGERLLCRLLRTTSNALETRPTTSRVRFVAWFAVAIGATMSHLAADLVYSGAEGLSDWHLQLLWPISSRGFVFPMVHWGDAGVTIIFVVSMFVMIRNKSRVQSLALITLALVVVYIVIRGTWLA